MSSMNCPPVPTEGMAEFKAKVDQLIDEATREMNYPDDALMLRMDEKVFMLFIHYLLQLSRARESGKITVKEEDKEKVVAPGARDDGRITYRGVRIDYGKGYQLEMLYLKPRVDEDFQPGESPIASAFKKAFKE